MIRLKNIARGLVTGTQLQNSFLTMLGLGLSVSWQVANGQTYRLDNFTSPDSYFLVVTDTAGLLGFLGHRHAILAQEWQAELVLDLANLANSSIEVSAQTDSLILDTEQAYRLAGLDNPPPPEEARSATLERILGPEVLNVPQNPIIQFESDTVAVMSRGSDATATLSMSGELQLRADLAPPAAIEVTTRVEPAPGKLIFEGSTEVLQSEFGIKPFSAAGVVRVRDQIQIIWHLEIERE